MRHFYLVIGLAEKVNKAAVCSVKLCCFARCTKIAIKFLLSRLIASLIGQCCLSFQRKANNGACLFREPNAKLHLGLEKMKYRAAVYSTVSTVNS